MEIYTRLRFTVLVLLTVFSHLAHAATHPDITIVSPQQETVIAPRSTIHVVIAIDRVLDPQLVEIVGPPVVHESDSTASYELDVTVPHRS